jgi:hypothetical protein
MAIAKQLHDCIQKPPPSEDAELDKRKHTQKAIKRDLANQVQYSFVHLIADHVFVHHNIFLPKPVPSHLVIRGKDLSGHNIRSLWTFGAFVKVIKNLLALSKTFEARALRNFDER